MAAKVSQEMLTGGDILADLARWFPPQGTQSQLWFLLYGALISILFNLSALAGNLPGFVARRPAVALAAAGAISILVLDIANPGELPVGVAVPLSYIPSILFGFLFFVFRESPVRLAVLTALATGLGLILLALGLRMAVELSLGAPLFYVAFLLRLPELRFARALGGLSMSVFLVHAMVIAVVVVSPLDGVAASAAVVGLSVCAAIAIRRLGLERYLQ